MGSPRRTIHLMHTQPQLHNVKHFRDSPRSKHKQDTYCLRGRGSCAAAPVVKPKCCLFKYFGDGGNRSPCHSPFYRHQQVIPGHAAAEGEPDGTSAARSGGWEHNKAQFFTTGARKCCRAKKPDRHRIFAYLRELREINHLYTSAAIHADIRAGLHFSVLNS